MDLKTLKARYWTFRGWYAELPPSERRRVLIIGYRKFRIWWAELPRRRRERIKIWVFVIGFVLVFWILDSMGVIPKGSGDGGGIVAPLIGMGWG